MCLPQQSWLWCMDQGWLAFAASVLKTLTTSEGVILPVLTKVSNRM